MYYDLEGTKPPDVSRDMVIVQVEDSRRCKKKEYKVDQTMLKTEMKYFEKYLQN